MTVTALSALTLAGCGDDASEESAQAATAAPSHSSGDLRSALMTEFSGTAAGENLEDGVYGELAIVQANDAARERVELDKPECQDAAEAWSRLPEIREAPAAVAVLDNDTTSITQVLVAAPPEAAETAVNTRPAENCLTYQATIQAGEDSSQTFTYEIENLDLEPVGENSRAFMVTASNEDVQLEFYTLFYRTNDYFSTVTLHGADASLDMLREFATTAQRKADEALA
ncbi:hypothetical protein [Allonocardiopsis opalescens]|uniref:hypothetical protein n=1 Tax=Allonocardiopsis opalescens TaxID=1144618 RepID=UPI0011B1D5AE|nr:hypothetical protein [Allonocardiopsis opalescens]